MRCLLTQKSLLVDESGRPVIPEFRIHEASMVKMAYETLPERLGLGLIFIARFATSFPRNSPHLEGFASVAMPFLLFHWAHWHE